MEDEGRRSKATKRPGAGEARQRGRLHGSGVPGHACLMWATGGWGGVEANVCAGGHVHVAGSAEPGASRKPWAAGEAKILEHDDRESRRV